MNGRASGFDFSDGATAGPTGLTMDAHPDLTLNMGNPNLQRNVTERNRMQGLMRIPTMRGIRDPTPMDAKSLTLKERWDLWMVNEGGRRLFFYFIILLHILVFLFGWFNYALKDNEVTARATFGVTFGACFLWIIYSTTMLNEK